MGRRWVLIALAVPVVLIGVAFVVGSMLAPGHVASSRAVYGQDPGLIWAVISDIEGRPDWSSGVSTMRRGEDRDGRPTWIAEGEWGRVPSFVTEWEPPHLMALVVSEDAGIGFSGSWTYVVEAEGHGASLTITEQGAVASPMLRFVSLFLDEHATIERFLRDLGAHLGEEVQPARLPR